MQRLPPDRIPGHPFSKYNILYDDSIMTVLCIIKNPKYILMRRPFPECSRAKDWLLLDFKENHDVFEESNQEQQFTTMPNPPVKLTPVPSGPPALRDMTNMTNLEAISKITRSRHSNKSHLFTQSQDFKISHRALSH